MKTKLLAVSVFVLALGINTVEAQNRRGSGENNQYEKQGGQNNGFSGRENRNDDRSFEGRDNDHRFNNRDNDRDFRSDRGMRNRQRNEFDRRGESGRRSYECKRYQRRNNF